MQIRDVKIYVLEAALTEPFAYSQAWYERRGACLVEIVGEDGNSGWGEAFGPARLTAQTPRMPWSPIALPFFLGIFPSFLFVIGAHVTGVCSMRNVDLVRSIGADRVVDYTQEDFTQSGQRYDLILDCVGNRSLSDYRRAMSPRGNYVMVGGPAGRWIGPLDRALKALLLSAFVSQNLFMFVASINKEDLAVLKELIEAKKLTPVIDRRYTLSEVPEAIRYSEQGHARGKVVITLEDEVNDNEHHHRRVTT